MKELLYIQSRLKAPKNQKNNFGNYSYRSLEDIVEAVKPLLAETGCTLDFQDQIEMLGVPFVCKDLVDMGYEDEKKIWHPDIREIEVIKGVRYFLKATAILTNGSGESVTTTAYAEHPEKKAGMDPAQVTGATSSYARKYAACALFAIDDNKDPDATNDGREENPRRPGRTSHTPAPRKNQEKDAPSQSPATPPKAPVKPAVPPPVSTPPAPPEDPREKQLKFMAAMGVTREMVETALGKDFYTLDERDSVSLRNTVAIMRKDKLSFEDAWERVCIMESNQEGESK